MRDGVLKTLKYLNELEGRKGGLSLGFDCIDNHIGGFQRGRLNVVASRTSVGKSAFIENITLNIAANGYNILYFSAESSELNMMLRLLSIKSDIDLAVISKMQMSIDQQKKIDEVAKELSTYNLNIDDTPLIAVDVLYARAVQLMKDDPIDIIFIDNIQLLTASNCASREQEVGYITRKLKALAQELAVPIVVTSQLSRNTQRSQSNKPKLSELRDSGTIEDVADLVILLYRPKCYGDTHDEDGLPCSPNCTEVIIAKNRFGCTCSLELFFKCETLKFSCDDPSISMDKDDGAKYWESEKSFEDISSGKNLF